MVIGGTSSRHVKRLQGRGETCFRAPSPHGTVHVVVNAAMSADGKLSSHRREQIDISGPEDFARVDRMRADADAVMVGVGTVLADDPRLEGPQAGGGAQPARVVADSRARTPRDAVILDDLAKTYILVTAAAPESDLQALRDRGAEIIVAGEDRVALPAALKALESRGISELMIEGGGELLFSCFDAGLVDELSVYVGSMLIGGRDAPTLIDGPGWVENFPPLELTDVTHVDDGILLHYVPV
jgi:2,5-diamino-6-(ribosylamino)-4(3H)-pyrimidinone 5'-phosphate reductase